MRFALCLFATLILVTALAGCANRCRRCNCGHAHGAGHFARGDGYGQQMGPAGPPSATYGYPYYTLRGPRDFLTANPPSIGQ